MNRIAIVTLTIVAMAMCVPTANATLYNVDFNDADGPHWTGVVDTVANTLTINTWVENSVSGGTNLWTPSATQLAGGWVWTALNSGGVHDVPDTWDGTMGPTWGFLPSEADNTLISWNEGTYTDNRFGIGFGARRFLGSDQFSHPDDQTLYVPRNTTSTDFAEGVVTVTVIPEPATALMLGAALTVGRLARRRRQRG